MPPILLIPGFLCTAEVFSSQIAALWPYGSVTIASTLEGNTLAEIAAAILADAPPKFALAGFSMGGYICFEIMRQAPERVTKLALINTSAHPDSAEQTVQRRGWIDKLNQKDFHSIMVSAIAAVAHPAQRDNAHLAEVNLRMADIIGVETFVRQTEAVISRQDSRPLLGDINVPTLVLTSDGDLLIQPAHSEEMARIIPQARLKIIKQCGHNSPLEQPAKVSQALIEWVSA